MPSYFAFILFLGETGCRIGEAIELRWRDVDLDFGIARVYRVKTGGEPTDLEISDRLRDVLRDEFAGRLREAMRRGSPDEPVDETLVFRNARGGRIYSENFRRQVWNPVVLEAFGGHRHVTPHCLRHTWASLHLARGTPLPWIQEQGGWASSKVLLDTYVHYLRRETQGFANAISRSDRTRPHQASG